MQRPSQAFGRGRMDHKYVKQVADKHYQKFENSCSPSAIELVLKVHERVPYDFYELQDKYGNENVGFEPFANREIHGVQFTEHKEKPPFIHLRGLVGMEHGANRCVVVATIEPKGKAHIWLTTEPVSYGALAVSKDLKQTVEIDIFRERLDVRPHGHYLTYKLVE